MRIATLSACAALLLASSANGLSSIPQISDYGIPAFAYSTIAMFTSWSSQKNLKADKPWKAVDAGLGLYGVYGLDSSHNIYNQTSNTWVDLGI
jgi:hypothetical protein